MRHRSSAGSETRIQYGALPYRFTAAGEVEFLLVTSRRSRRWIIPKGWPVKGLGPAKSAAREAFEEAGVLGKIGRQALGSFQYLKQLNDNDEDSVLCQVHVFPLRVKRELVVWPEAQERELRWLCTADAAMIVDDDGLKHLIGNAAGQMKSFRAQRA